MGDSMVPFLDFRTLHRELVKELMEILRRAVRSACFIGGPEMDRFETEFADFCETRHRVGVDSGSMAPSQGKILSLPLFPGLTAEKRQGFAPPFRIV